MTASPTTPPGVGDHATAFERALVAGGTDARIAQELERRIAVIEAEEMDGPSRRPMTGREIAVYVGVSVVAVIVGLVVVL